MDMFKTFEEYLAQSSAQIPIMVFVINLIFTGFMAFILKQVYVKYGSTLSNRRLFGNNFILIAMTTMFIITVIKSSLALSLGLVGALSIIRFRSAIKEPEELAYLFLAISIGLGFGANQGPITLIALIIILLIIVFSKKQSYKSEDKNSLNLTIMSNKPSEIVAEDIVETLKKHCSAVNIKRLDYSEEVFEATFFVEYSNYEKLLETQKEIQQLNSGLKFTFLDTNNIF